MFLHWLQSHCLGARMIGTRLRTYHEQILESKLERLIPHTQSSLSSIPSGSQDTGDHVSIPTKGLLKKRLAFAVSTPQTSLTSARTCDCGTPPPPEVVQAEWLAPSRHQPGPKYDRSKRHRHDYCEVSSNHSSQLPGRAFWRWAQAARTCRADGEHKRAVVVGQRNSSSSRRRRNTCNHRPQVCSGVQAMAQLGTIIKVDQQ